MEKVTRWKKDYWQMDFLNPKEKSGVATKFGKDVNPIENKSRQKRYSFIVDWQVCDEEHLG